MQDKMAGYKSMFKQDSIYVKIEKGNICQYSLKRKGGKAI